MPFNFTWIIDHDNFACYNPRMVKGGGRESKKNGDMDCVDDLLEKFTEAFKANDHAGSGR